MQYFLLILLTVGNDQALCYHCFILSLIFVHVYFLLLEFNNGDHPKKKKKKEREREDIYTREIAAKSERIRATSHAANSERHR